MSGKEKPALGRDKKEEACEEEEQGRKWGWEKRWVAGRTGKTIRSRKQKSEARKMRRWSHKKTGGRKEVQNNQGRLGSSLTCISWSQIIQKERL